MSVWIFAILLINVLECVTAFELLNVEDMREVAQFGDAENRGPTFYDYEGLTSKESLLSTLENKNQETSLRYLIGAMHSVVRDTVNINNVRFQTNISSCFYHTRNRIHDDNDNVLTYSESSSDTSSGSSKVTSEKKRATQYYRACTACIHDMLKKHTNIGIKWICGGYQRARRSFKSECMMRYRNCQDGTMFVKLYDHKCKRDPYHGRTWFYVYKV